MESNSDKVGCAVSIEPVPSCRPVAHIAWHVRAWPYGPFRIAQPHTNLCEVDLVQRPSAIDAGRGRVRFCRHGEGPCP